MSAKFLAPAILAALLAGCAATDVATDAGPARPRVAVPAATLMTDGHPELEAAPAEVPQPARAIALSAPAVTVMSDAPVAPGAPGQPTVKGSGSAH